MEASHRHKSWAEEAGPPLCSESRVIVGCDEQHLFEARVWRRGRLTGQANERRLEPNIQIISDLIRTPLFYKSWAAKNEQREIPQDPCMDRRPDPPTTCLCAIKSENSSINRVKKENKSQSFHAYWMCMYVSMIVFWFKILFVEDFFTGYFYFCPF